MEIYPSLISSDLLYLASTLTLLDQHCDGYHLDVMDDHFVPNLTWGPAFINAIAEHTKLPLNVHLMVDNPEIWVPRLNLTQKDSFIFHWEAIKNSERVKTFARVVRSKKVKVGIAINPTTMIEDVVGCLIDCDQVLLMSVEPGFSGQSFIDVTSKISALKSFRAAQQLSFAIGMDGGISTHNIKSLTALGVDFVGVASAIFSQADPVNALKNLYRIVAGE